MRKTPMSHFYYLNFYHLNAVRSLEWSADTHSQQGEQDEKSASLPAK